MLRLTKGAPIRFSHGIARRLVWVYRYDLDALAAFSFRLAQEKQFASTVLKMGVATSFETCRRLYTSYTLP